MYCTWLFIFGFVCITVHRHRCAVCMMVSVNRSVCESLCLYACACRLHSRACAWAGHVCKCQWWDVWWTCVEEKVMICGYACIRVACLSEWTYVTCIFTFKEKLNLHILPCMLTSLHVSVWVSESMSPLALMHEHMFLLKTIITSARCTCKICIKCASNLHVQKSQDASRCPGMSSPSPGASSRRDEGLSCWGHARLRGIYASVATAIVLVSCHHRGFITNCRCESRWRNLDLILSTVFLKCRWNNTKGEVHNSISYFLPCPQHI